MKKIVLSFSVVLITIMLLMFYSNINSSAQANKAKFEIKLPNPARTGKVSLDEALQNRRTKRLYSDSALSKQELSQLLWAAMGANTPQGRRTSPSAGATYPLDIIIVVGNVKDVPAGIYSWSNSSNALSCLQNGDMRNIVAEACNGQDMIKKAAINIIYVANWNRIKPKYKERSEKYCNIEAGHSAQNVLLECSAMNFGACPIGAYDENKISSMLKLDSNQTPMYILTVGKIKKD